jgi:hypothetical protein
MVTLDKAFCFKGGQQAMNGAFVHAGPFSNLRHAQFWGIGGKT